MSSRLHASRIETVCTNVYVCVWMEGTPSLPGVHVFVLQDGYPYWTKYLAIQIGPDGPCLLDICHCTPAFFLQGRALTWQHDVTLSLVCPVYDSHVDATPLITISAFHGIIGSWGQWRVFTRGHNTGRGYWLIVHRQQADLHRVGRCNLQLPGLVIWYYEIQYLHWTENIPKFLQYPWQHSPYPSPEHNIGTKFSKV